jgi:RHS repeat-associated protein
MNAYGGRRHFHLDHLGTTRVISNESGLKLARHDYYPFGIEKTFFAQEWSEHNYDRPEPMAFTGHQRDFMGVYNIPNENYLDYMHARYYQPQLGRFLSVDPVIGDPYSPQSWNRYAYVLNDPLNLTDPFGLAPCRPGDPLTPEGCDAEVTAPDPVKEFWKEVWATEGRWSQETRGELRRRAAHGDDFAYDALITSGDIAPPETDPLLDTADTVGEYLLTDKDAQLAMTFVPAWRWVGGIRRLDASIIGTKKFAQMLFRRAAGSRATKVIRDRATGRIVGVRTVDGRVIYRPKGAAGANVEVINSAGHRINVHVRTGF